MRESESWPDSSFYSEKGNQFSTQFLKFPVCCRTARIDNEVEACRNECSRCTENFSNPSLDPIAIVRFAKFPRRCETDTAVTQPVRHQKDYKRLRNSLCTLCIYVLELNRLSQSKVFWKCVCIRDKHRPNYARLSCVKRLIVLDRHAFTAFISPRLQHEPASSCLHPGPKSMRLGAPAIIRLVCPLWHFDAPSKT